MDFQWGVLSRLRYHSIDWEIFVTDDSYSDDWELLTKVDQWVIPSAGSSPLLRLHLRRLDAPSMVVQ